MKRILFGFPAFFAAFVVGYMTVLLSLTILFCNNDTSPQDPEPPLMANAVSATQEDSTTATKPNDHLEMIEEVNDIWTDTPSKNSTRLLEVGEGMPRMSPHEMEKHGSDFLRQAATIFFAGQD